MRYTLRKRIPVCAAALFLSALTAIIAVSGCYRYPQNGYSSRVVYVYDGDTVKLANGEDIRYLGINTPEMNYKNPPAEYFAEDAKEFNRRLVEGKIVRLEFDAQKKDKYGRTLAYVYAGDIFVNRRMVEEGYAKVLVIPPNEKYADDFIRLQRKARKQRKGLWSR